MDLQWIAATAIAGACAAWAAKTLAGALRSRRGGCAGCERNAAREQPLVFQPRKVSPRVRSTREAAGGGSDGTTLRATAQASSRPGEPCPERDRDASPKPGAHRARI